MIVQELLETGKRFDIVFLDIKMDGMEGIEMARTLREKQDEPVLIFVMGNRGSVELGGQTFSV